MVSIKRAVIFGSIPAIVVVVILISVAAFYTKEVYTEIDIQAPKQHLWMITTNNTTTELGLTNYLHNLNLTPIYEIYRCSNDICLPISPYHVREEIVI
jgi:hypothetical protein